MTPSSGTTACVAMIVSINVHIFFRRLRVGFVARPLVSALNGVAEVVDSRSTPLRTPEQPGTLFANFHVVAEVPQ